MLKKTLLCTLCLLMTTLTLAFAEQGGEITGAHLQNNSHTLRQTVPTQEITVSTLTIEEQKASWLGYLASYAAYVDVNTAGGPYTHDTEAFNTLVNTYHFKNLQTITLEPTNWYSKSVQPTFTIGSNDTEHYYIVAFRGTNMANGMNPLLADAPAAAVPFESTGTKVHVGFYVYMQFMRDDARLKDFIKKFNSDTNSEKKLLVSGTSLGGATAVLYAAYLIEHNIVPTDKMIVAVTADPAAGDLAFCQRYSTIKPIHCINIIRQDDIVPVITESFTFGHFGKTFVEKSSPQNYHDADLWLEHYADSVYVPLLEFLTPAFDKHGFKLHNN